MTRIGVYTPTRHPGISVSWHSVVRQDPPVDYWLVADQLMLERDASWQSIRSRKTPIIKTYHAEILPERVGNLAHVDNWALNQARELELDLLVILQDFIWVPEDGVSKFYNAAKYHPFDLITGNVISSIGPEKDRDNIWSIFKDSSQKPPEPYTPDTRDQMGWGVDLNPALSRNIPATGKYISQHAWEMNWAAMPHAIINAGVDFDEDYDYGTQWENTDFAFAIKEKFDTHNPGAQKGRVWWDYYNQAISMPHRDYFPKTHEGERDVDNQPRFRSKWGNV